jgi:anaerobic ribonucleoside-triphosphate reductase
MTSEVGLNDSVITDGGFNLNKIWDDSHFICYICGVMKITPDGMPPKR